ncbi:MAG: tetratricopeptide repeat protein [Cyclobacteriaceae bacterium]|nr:tetratricopeptide repeat protein [Cyclobacteriaceae bacterium]
MVRRNLLPTFILFFACNMLLAQTAKEFTQTGMSFYEKKQYLEAILHFNKAIEKDNTYSKAYFLRGSIKENFDDRHGAMQDFNKAVELNKNYSEAYFARGNVKFILQDYYGAIDDFSKVIELDDSNVKAYLKRGEAKQRLEAYEDAINDCTRIIEINTKNIDAYFLRGILRIEYGHIEAGCLDLSKAGELGDSKAYEIIRERCNQSYLKN